MKSSFQDNSEQDTILESRVPNLNQEASKIIADISQQSPIQKQVEFLSISKAFAFLTFKESAHRAKQWNQGYDSYGSHDGHEDSKKYECRCGKIYKTSGQLRIHLKNKHPINSEMQSYYKGELLRNKHKYVYPLRQNQRLLINLRLPQSQPLQLPDQLKYIVSAKIMKSLHISISTINQSKKFRNAQSDKAIHPITSIIVNNGSTQFSPEWKERLTEIGVDHIKHHRRNTQVHLNNLPTFDLILLFCYSCLAQSQASSAFLIDQGIRMFQKSFNGFIKWLDLNYLKALDNHCIPAYQKGERFSEREGSWQMRLFIKEYEAKPSRMWEYEGEYGRVVLSNWLAFLEEKGLGH